MNGSRLAGVIACLVIAADRVAVDIVDCIVVEYAVRSILRGGRTGFLSWAATTVPCTLLQSLTRGDTHVEDIADDLSRISFSINISADSVLTKHRVERIAS